MSKSRIENRQGPVSSVQSEFNKALVKITASEAWTSVLSSYLGQND